MHLIPHVYAIEEPKRLACHLRRNRIAPGCCTARLIAKLHKYLLESQQKVLPKSPSAAAVRYMLNQWEALTVF